MHVLGVSMPRSGHHLLERLLRAAFGENMRYCEFHKPEDCCKGIPCTRHGGFAAGDGHLFVQKNHDFMLSHPILAADKFSYLIQHRQPLPRLSSSYELHVTQYSGGHSQAFMETFLAKEAAYQRGFVEKWVLAPKVPTIDLPYEVLTDTPIESLAEVLAALGHRGDTEAAAAEAFAGVSGFRDARNTQYRPRQIEAATYYDPLIFAAADAYLQDHLPTMAYPRLREEADPAYASYFADLTDGFYRVFADDLEGACAAWSSALDRSAHNPHVFETLDIIVSRRRLGRQLSLPLRITQATRLQNIEAASERFPLPPRDKDLDGMQAFASAVKKGADGGAWGGADDYLDISKLYTAWGHNGRALFYADLACETNPSHTLAAQRFARLSLNAGRPRQALSACQRCMDAGTANQTIVKLADQATAELNRRDTKTPS